MADWSRAFQNAVNPQIQPGDEAQAASNMSNFFLGMVGAPSSWKMSVADEKRGIQGLPRSMGEGTVGMVNKVGAGTGKLLQGSLSQIAASPAVGKEVSAASQLALQSKGLGAGASKFGKVFVLNKNDGGDVPRSPSEEEFSAMSPEEQSQYSVLDPAAGGMSQGPQWPANAGNQPGTGSWELNPAGASLEQQLPANAASSSTYNNLLNDPVAPADPQLPDYPTDSNAQPPQPTQPMSQDMSGFSNQKAGILKQANAETAQAGAEAKAAIDRQSAANELAMHYGKTLEGLETQRKALFDDIKDGHIDPNKYVNGLGTAGKIQSAIGIFLSGLGTAMAHGQGNPALDFFNKQIERDIDAQKSNITHKQNLMSAIDDEMKHATNSADAARVVYMDQYSAKIAEAAAKSKDPMAQGRALQLIGMLQAQTAPLMQQIAMRQTTVEGGKAGIIPIENQISKLIPPQQMNRAIDDLSKYNVAKKAGESIERISNEVAKLQSAESRFLSPIQSQNTIDALNFNALTIAKPLMGNLSESEKEDVQKSLHIRFTDDANTVKRKVQNLRELAQRAAPDLSWMKAHGVTLPKETVPGSRRDKPANYGR